jgi:hypothetical protein
MNLEEDLGIEKAISKIVFRHRYKAANKALDAAVKRDPSKSRLSHAAKISRIFNVDARNLATFKEEAPTNSVGGGNIAGLGIGSQGEPGVNPKNKKKVVPFKTFIRNRVQ